jgi:hypothetical protein
MSEHHAWLRRIADAAEEKGYYIHSMGPDREGGLRVRLDSPNSDVSLTITTRFDHGTYIARLPTAAELVGQTEPPT